MNVDRCKSRSVLLLLLLLAACCYAPVKAANPAETASLRALLQATGGNTWIVKEGWSLATDNSTTNACTWFGVYCDLNDRVTEINLRRNNLIGNLSAFDFSAFTALTIFDVSSNLLRGGLHTSLFTLPAIQSVRANSNRISVLPVWSQVPVNTSLTSLYLADNWFPCPLPKFATLPARIRAAWIDVNVTSCMRTQTRTRQITRTVIVEPPVGQVINSTDIAGLRLTTIFNASSPNISALFVSVIKGVCVIEGVLSSDSDLSTVLWLNFSTYDVYVTFRSDVSLAFRRNLANRFKTQHSSVARLSVQTTIIISSSTPQASTTPAPTESTSSSGITSGAVVAILVAGIVLVIILFSVVAFCLCRRNQAFVKATNLHPQLQNATHSQTFSRTKSLRLGGAS